jgi:hypothetical protein
MQIAVLVGTYLLLFQQIRNHHQILRFLYPNPMFWGAVLDLFANFEAIRARNGLKTRKIFFPNVNQKRVYFSILVSDQQAVKNRFSLIYIRNALLQELYPELPFIVSTRGTG